MSPLWFLRLSQQPHHQLNVMRQCTLLVNIYKEEYIQHRTDIQGMRMTPTFSAALCHIYVRYQTYFYRVRLIIFHHETVNLWCARLSCISRRPYAVPVTRPTDFSLFLRISQMVYSLYYVRYVICISR